MNIVWFLVIGLAAGECSGGGFSFFVAEE